MLSQQPKDRMPQQCRRLDGMSTHRPEFLHEDKHKKTLVSSKNPVRLMQIKTIIIQKAKLLGADWLKREGFFLLLKAKFLDDDWALLC